MGIVVPLKSSAGGWQLLDSTQRSFAHLLDYLYPIEKFSFDNGITFRG